MAGRGRTRRVRRARSPSAMTPTDDDEITDDDVDHELVALSRATYDSASRFYRLADVFGTFMIVLSVLGYLGCIVIGVAGRTTATITEAIVIAAGITLQLVAILFVVAWGKTYALDIQRRVARSAH